MRPQGRAGMPTRRGYRREFGLHRGWWEQRVDLSKGAVTRLRAKGTSLVVQWLGLHASTAGGMRLIPGRGTKMPHAASAAKKKKKKD